jgi:DNA-binding cell septation regulator SpoVG
VVGGPAFFLGGCVKVTKAMFRHYTTPRDEGLRGFCSVVLDGVLVIDQIRIRNNKDGVMDIELPCCKNKDRYYGVVSILTEPLLEEIRAECIEQYELFHIKRTTAINHPPVKPAGSNRRLTFG